LLNLPIESGFLVILAWQEVQPCLSETKPRGAVPLGTGILSQPKRIGREPAVFVAPIHDAHHFSAQRTSGFLVPKICNSQLS
jgi:hypothetical protein